MRRIASLAALVTLAAAAPAAATPVLVLHGRHAVLRERPLVPPTDLPGVAAGKAGPGTLARRRTPKPPSGPPPTQRALTALAASGALSAADQVRYQGVYSAAAAAVRGLRGTPKLELGAVVANADDIARRGFMTPDRLAAIFLTLDRNRQWWTTSNVPSPHERVSFDSSQLVWEYYPGAGLEIQMLGSWGEANGLWASGDDEGLRSLLAELVPLAALRGGALAWEYLFPYAGGAPPWTSGLSQATAIQALARAGKRLNDPTFGQLALRGIGVFQQPPPAGVRADGAAGPHYLLYSFAPDTRVINGFLGAVYGLWDAWHTLGDATLGALYQAGEAEARAELPAYDTGAWSLYEPGQEADFSYHQLVISFLHNLCRHVGVPEYCDYEQRFTGYARRAPVVAVAPARVRAQRPGALAFTIDKISRVRAEVSQAGQVVFTTSGTAPRGSGRLTWPNPPTAGAYTLRVVARDLAGNSAEATAPLTVLPPPKPKKGRRHSR